MAREGKFGGESYEEMEADSGCIESGIQFWKTLGGVVIIMYVLLVRLFQDGKALLVFEQTKGSDCRTQFWKTEDREVERKNIRHHLDFFFLFF